MLRKGFTLVELLVVIAIVAVLSSVLIVNLSAARDRAEIAKCQDLVQQVKVALDVCFKKNDGLWSPALIENHNQAGGLDAKAGYVLATLANMSLHYDKNSRRLSGSDKFGILTPWGAAVVQRKGTSCTDSTPVPSVGGTIADHRLRYALSMEGNNTIRGVNPRGTVPGALVDADTVDIRDNVAVWCLGPKGRIIRSWGDGQTRGVR